MWFKTIFNRKRQGSGVKGQGSGATKAATSRFTVDEAFLRRLEKLSLQAQRTLRGNPSSGEHLSRQQLPTTIFSDHRPYSTGDDPRHVDWNAYARQEAMVIKLGEAEQDVDIHLLLDVSRSMGWGTPPKLLVGQQLVAALGYLALAHSDRLRITPFGAAALAGFGPVQGKARLIEMLRFVGNVQPSEQTGLARVLQTYARQYERGGVLVICSDFLSEPADGLAEGLRAFAPPRWQVLVLHLLDPREVQPDLSGPLELEDAETGQRLPLVLDVPTLAAYKRNVAQWQESLRVSCARRGATYAPVMTDWPLERSVVPYLRVRRILQ